MTAAAWLRSCSSAETSRFSTTSSLIRRLRHWLLKTLNSYLSHVQPTAVYWSVVELQALGDAPCFGWLEGIVQRAELVSVEIVQHQPYRLCVRVCLVNQPPHLMSEVHSSALLGHLDMSPASFRLTEHEQVSGAVPLVLVVISFNPTRLGPDGRSLIGHHVAWTSRRNRPRDGPGRSLAWYRSSTSSIRATNSPLTSGMHHSFFFHGLSSFF